MDKKFNQIRISAWLISVRGSAESRKPTADSRWPLLALLLLLTFPSFGQRAFSLGEAVGRAQGESPYYYRARNSYERSYWRYQNFRAGFRPQIRLNATIPTFFRAINPVTQPDGSIAFRRITQANNSLGLSLVQNLGLTGGQFRLGTRLQRTANFGSSAVGAPQSSYFLSSPFSVSYSQGSLLYNELRWRRQLEPLYYETAQKSYAEEMEKAAVEGVFLFLDALVAQVNTEIATANLANADTLYAITKERFALGTVALSDLLQLELNLLKAKNQRNAARLEAEAARRNMKRILGLDLADSLTLQEPPVPPRFVPDYETALAQARDNRQSVLEFRTKRLAAEQEIALAKGNNSLQFSLQADLGTQQTASNLAGAYQNLQNQQYIGVTLDMPLVDWGQRKSQIRLAKANRELVEVNVQQDELNFEQEIYLQVLRFGQQYDRLRLAQQADTIAQRRLAITKERYLVGKVTVTDLNLALEENVMAREGYIRGLDAYWRAYYTLRRLTLYDFEKKEPLGYEP